MSDLVELWMHQNTLLWSRLQLVAILQAGAIAAWWVVLMEHDAPIFAIFAAAFAFLLSVIICCLIERDLEWREGIRERIRACNPLIMPELEGSPRGHQTIRLTAYLFVLADIALIVMVPFVR